MTFSELNIAEPVLRALAEKGYETPTPIQEQAIPVLMAGRDIFGIARTGTGKTAAFAIPIILKLMEEHAREDARAAAEASRERKTSADAAVAEARAVTSEPAGDGQPDAEATRTDSAAPAGTDTTEAAVANESAAGANENAAGAKEGDTGTLSRSHSRRRGRRHGKPARQRVIRALVLTPTRELALQISDCFTDYSKYTDLKHTAVFGGVKQRSQVEKLRSGVDILIATPGRLLDLMGQGYVNLDSLGYLVLDEADRMLDMGFIADIRRLVSRLPRRRQTMLFSATMPDAIVSLSRWMLHDPERIEVTPQASTVDEVKQRVYFVENADKKELLVSLLRDHPDDSVLIFARTKHGADGISKSLRRAGIRNDAIHGDKSQGERQRALDEFKTGKVKVLVATDIAARGIDIQELQVVINYDIPDVPETYVHRIGRTGRAGHGGTALTFCTFDEHMIVNDIQRLTGRRIESVLYDSYYD